MGIYHNVSREYLPSYLNDGEGTLMTVQSAEGKRLMYRSTASAQPEQL